MQQNNISPFFSIIVPTRDRSSLLMKALASIFTQSFSDFEVIVVDDNSVDDTKTQLATLSDTRLILLDNSARERSAARNTGIENARGRYICFLDDDDMYEKDYLKDFHQRLQSLNFPTDIILRTAFYKYYEDGKLKQGVLYQETIHKNPVRFAAYNMCGVWSLCVPYQCLRDYRFDERYPHWQDTHLILRLLGKYEMIQIEKYNYCYRIHKEMGSQYSYDAKVIFEKAKINVDAIVDFFNKNDAIVKENLSKDTLKFLVAEKYLQYAIRLMGLNRKLALVLLSNSLKSGIYFKLWKSYIILLKKIIG